MKPGTREYQTLHKRMQRVHGTPHYCVGCFSYDPEAMYHWAHKHDTPFTDNISNWFRMCPKCHSKYDITLEQRREICRLGGLTAAGVPRHSYTDDFKKKVSDTLKSKGIVPPSRKGARNTRLICIDCGVEYGSNWMRRHKVEGRCV